MEWTTFVYYVIKTVSPYQRNHPSHLSQKAISVHIFIGKKKIVIYSYWVLSFIWFLGKFLLHFCSLGNIYHMNIAEKWEDILSLILFFRIALDQISHTWFDWNLANGCSLHEENSMDKLKAAMIFIVVATYSSPWKNSKHYSLKPVE